MPSIIIPEKELIKAKAKMGVYSSLRKPAFEEKVKPIRFSDVILPLIEDAFREYAKAHKGVTKEIEDKAWKDFLSKLRKRL